MRAAISLTLAAALAACAADDPAPVADVIGAAPAELDPADDALDDLTITVDYTDADGDLGGGHAEVHDCRAADLVTLLPLPAIASDAAVAEGVPIRGTLDLVVTDVGFVDASPAPPPACAGVALAADSAMFCVHLRDAADHLGPASCTPAITIRRPPD